MVSSVGSYSTLQHLQHGLHTGNQCMLLYRRQNSNSLSVFLYTIIQCFSSEKKALNWFCMLGVPEELVQAYITVLLQYKKLTLGSKGIRYRKNKKTQGKQALDPFWINCVLPNGSLLSTAFKALPLSPCCPPPETNFFKPSVPNNR